MSPTVEDVELERLLDRFFHAAHSVGDAARAALRSYLSADKRRLDWLEKGGIDDLTRNRDRHGVEDGRILLWGDTKWANQVFPDLRSAIDSAMQERKDAYD